MFASRHPPRMGGSTLFGSPRGTESPMDFEYTDRPKTRGVWATGDSGDPSTPPRKRPFGEMHPPPSPFPGPSSPAPMFAKTGVPNVPFVMNIPAPHTSHPPPWVPPDRDVDMADVSIASADTSMADATSPSKPQGSGKDGEKERDDEGERGKGQENEDVRTISVGGLRRLFKSRQRQRGRSQKALVKVGGGMSVSDDEDSDEELHTPVQNMSNHYTLNLSGPAAQTDMPAVLTGYLQFAFNCSLAAVFFYLLVLAIFTVQRDVQHRLGEYSMDMVQEIAQCTLHYKQNLCGTAPVPAMLHQCGLWETCMNRDPSKVGTARVVAELVAEVINSFVEPISWKTLLFTILSLTTITAFVNSMPAFFRRPATAHPTHALPPPHAYHVPPVVLATPHRGRLAHRSYQDGSRSGYQGGGWQDWHPEEELEMPSRRRKLESGGVQEIR